MQHAAPAQFALTNKTSTFAEWFASYLAIRASFGLYSVQPGDRGYGFLRQEAYENYECGCTDREAAGQDKANSGRPLSGW